MKIYLMFTQNTYIEWRHVCTQQFCNNDVKFFNVCLSLCQRNNSTSLNSKTLLNRCVIIKLVVYLVYHLSNAQNVLNIFCVVYNLYTCDLSQSALVFNTYIGGDICIVRCQRRYFWVDSQNQRQYNNTPANFKSISWN